MLLIIPTLVMLRIAVAILNFSGAGIAVFQFSAWGVNGIVNWSRVAITG